MVSVELLAQAARMVLDARLDLGSVAVVQSRLAVMAWAGEVLEVRQAVIVTLHDVIDVAPLAVTARSVVRRLTQPS